MSVSRRASFAAGIAAVRRQKKRANMGPRDIVEEAAEGEHYLNIRKVCITRANTGSKTLKPIVFQVKMIRMTPTTSPSSPGAILLRLRVTRRQGESAMGMEAVKMASTDQNLKCKRKSELSPKSHWRKSIYGQPILFVTMASYQRDPLISRMVHSCP